MANRFSQTQMQALAKAQRPSRGGTPQVQPGQMPNQRQIGQAPTGLGRGVAPPNQMLQPSGVGPNVQTLANFGAKLQQDRQGMGGMGAPPPSAGQVGIGQVGGMGPQIANKIGSGIMGGMGGATAPMGGMGAPQMPPGGGLGVAGGMGGAPAPMVMKKGGAVKAKAYAKGGTVSSKPKASSASSRGDGIAQRGKTKGRMC